MVFGSFSEFPTCKSRDDDERGNLFSDPRNCGEFNKNLEVREGVRKPSLAKQDPPKRREEPPKQVTPLIRDNRVQQAKRQEPLSKPNKPLNVQSGPGRPVKPNNGELKLIKDSRVQQKPMVQRRPPPQPEVLSSQILYHTKLSV